VPRLGETPQGQESPRDRGKSKAKAFFLSLVLPGAGELYGGSKTWARNFLVSEAFLWTTFAGFRTYGSWKEKDYRAFAATHAAVKLTGKDDGFFVNIGNYDSLEAYNQAKLRERNLRELYRDPDAYYWQWDSSANRRKYESIRLSSKRAFNRATILVGVVIANHLISAIDAVRVTHQYNRALQRSDLDVHFGWEGVGRDGRVWISLSTVF